MKLNKIKISQATLKALEEQLEGYEYKIRYERGAFQSGWCLLQTKKMVVLNKFLDLEGRINALMAIMEQVGIEKTIDQSKETEVVPSLVEQDKE